MTEFITIGRAEKDFNAYLNGTFSKDFRAIPRTSLNVDQDNEVVTFELIPVQQIKKTWYAWLQALRLHYVIVVLWPIVLVALSRKSVHWLVFATVFFTLSALQISINLMNDYFDYVKGFDRLFPNSGSQVIQSGLFAAYDLRNLGLLIALFAAIGGGILCVSVPKLWILVLVLVLLLGWEFWAEKLSFRVLGLSEAIVFVFAGPLLTTASAWTFFQSIQQQDILLGFSVGLFTLWPLHTKNFCNIMSSSQKGARNWVTLFGFDRSKKFLKYWYLVSLAMVTVYQLFDGLYGSALVCIVVFLTIGRDCLRRIESVQSCLGSDLIIARAQSFRVYFSIIFSWVLNKIYVYLA